MEAQAQLSRLVFNSLCDGVFTVDRNCVITSFNKAAERITQRLIALSLRTVAVNLRGRVTGTHQAASNAVGSMLGADENQVVCPAQR